MIINQKNVDILIFCQAGADLLYTVDLIEKNKYKTINVYVVNVESLYNYLKKLDLENVTLSFFEIPKIKYYNLNEIIKVKQKCIHLFSRWFSNINDTEVYFFSTSYDWLTALFVSKLSRNNTVIYYNHYDHLTALQGKRKFRLSKFLKCKILEFISDVRLDHMYTVNSPIFRFEDWDIQEMKVLKKPELPFKYKFKIPMRGTNVLFFLSPVELEEIHDRSIEKIRSFICKLKKYGINIFVKGHPRLGVPKKIMDLVDYEIPIHIPSEFMDYTNVNLLIGINSAALCYPAERELVKTFSLIDVLEHKNKSKADGFKSYISAYSNNKIQFIDETIFINMKLLFV